MGYTRDDEGGGENGLNAELEKVFDKDLSVRIEGLDDLDPSEDAPDETYKKWEAELARREAELAQREAALKAAEEAHAEELEAEAARAETAAEAGLSEVNTEEEQAEETHMEAAGETAPKAKASQSAGSDTISLDSVALELQTIYDGFTESVKALGGKGKKTSGKLKEGLLHVVAGGHIKGERELLCEKFLADVQKQMEMLSMYMEGASDEEKTSACTIAVRILTRPCPSKSNATTDLMKRAMIGQAEPILKYVPKEVLAEQVAAMKAEYGRFSMLPVEKQVKRAMEDLINA